MNTQYTPGPWSVEIDHRNNDPEFIRAHVDGEIYDLASVLCDETGNAAANARLIAAAPDLLDVLQEAVKVLDYAAFALDAPEASHFRATIADARAAITKATGENA